MNDEIQTQTPTIPRQSQSLQYEFSTNFTKLFKAIIEFQSEYSPPKKTKKNDHTRSSYSPLNEVVTSIIPAAKKNGLGWTQFPCSQMYGGKSELAIVTTIFHESGEWMRWQSIYPIGNERNMNQAIVAATTYAKRNELCSGFGVAPEDEDDDGNSTNKAQPAKKPAAKKKAPPRADSVQAPAALHQYARYLAAETGLKGAAINTFAQERCKKSATQLITDGETQRFCDALNTYAEEQGCVVMTLAQYMESGNE